MASKPWEQLDLFDPVPVFKVGVRTKSGEIQHYEVEALTAAQARSIAMAGLEDANVVVVRINKEEKKDGNKQASSGPVDGARA